MNNKNMFKVCIFLFFFINLKAVYQITYVLSVINIGRTHHGGHGMESGNYSFENDYLARLIDFLKLEWPVRIYIQKKYFKYIEPYLHKKVDVKLYEHDDLRNYKYYKKIQELRPHLQGTAKKCSNCTLELYNPVVMSKMEWLYHTAIDNPFNTQYFVWIDSNFYIKTFNKKNHSSLAPELNKFSMHYFNMPSHLWEVHGMLRTAHSQYCGGVRSNKLCRGMIFGGEKKSIEEVYVMYHLYLQKTLSEGHMGTEENILTFCYFSDPGKYNFKQEPYYYNHLGAS
jgi:Bacterial protein of unknown function (HtrL_YibB)